MANEVNATRDDPYAGGSLHLKDHVRSIIGHEIAEGKQRRDLCFAALGGGVDESSLSPPVVGFGGGFVERVNDLLQRMNRSSSLGA